MTRFDFRVLPSVHWVVLVGLATSQLCGMIWSWSGDPGLCEAVVTCAGPDCDLYGCIGRNPVGARWLIGVSAGEWVAAALLLWPAGPHRWFRAMLLGLVAAMFSVPWMFLQVQGGPIALLHLLGLWGIVGLSVVHGLVGALPIVRT